MNLTNTKKHEGYSSKLVYKKDSLSISRGRCNHYNDHTRIINISLDLLGNTSIYINLWEGYKYYDSMLKLLETSTKNHAKLLKHTWKIISALGDPKHVFEEVFESGRKLGRREKVEEINEVLNRE